MRILLVYPNADRRISGFNDLATIGEPIALEYIAAVGRSCGHEVKLLDLRLHNDELIPTLETFQPDVVGLTAYTQHVLRVLEVCRLAKRVSAHCTTICGGHHATLEPTDFLEPEVDLVVQGEGTIPFGKILECLEQGKTFEGLKGVWSKVGPETLSTKVRKGFVLGGAPAAFDVNAILPPDRSVTARDRSRYFISGMGNIALLRTTVGCPYRCSFCALWVAMDGRYYKRRTEKVIEELALLEEENVMLVDDEPFVNRRHIMALGHAIRDAGIKKRYYAYCRSDSFNREREALALWKSIGLTRLFIGVESIFDDELADYNKRQKREQVFETFAAAKELGISLHTNFIINTNYSDEQFDEIIKFIRDADLEYPSFTVLTPIPGTVDNWDDVLVTQRNGRPDWRYFDLQNAVTPTRLPAAAFRERFLGLYHAFSDVYAQHHNPYQLALWSRNQAQQAELSACS